jgi:hypothetical protein
MEEYELCLQLQEAIAMGKLKEAQDVTRKLAIKKINLSMFPLKTKDLVLTDMHKTTKTIVVNIHNQFGEKKGDLITASFFTKISEIKNGVNKMIKNNKESNLKIFSFLLIEKYFKKYRIPPESQYWILAGVLADENKIIGDYIENDKFFDTIDLYLSGDNLEKI